VVYSGRYSPLQCDPTASTVAHRLGGKQRLSNGGWLAKCPCHPDRTASLSLIDGHGGRLIVHCFAGCDWRDVRDELARLSILSPFERGRRR
jgi:hypothetical protein